MSAYPTPHIQAVPGDFAKIVLMPGDPLRARYIAENYLQNAVQINSVRGMLGYTGYFKGTKISIMASGMGIPSIGIYAYELYQVYGVESIIRIGSCGAIQHNLKLNDLVIAMGACTDSDFAGQYRLPGTFAPIADCDLFVTALSSARELDKPFVAGNILSSDVFYNDNPDYLDSWQKMGVLAVEMETAGLYMTAARCGKKALSICSVSDHLLRDEHLTPEQRQTGLENLFDVSLNVASRWGDKQ